MPTQTYRLSLLNRDGDRLDIPFLADSDGHALRDGHAYVKGLHASFGPEKIAGYTIDTLLIGRYCQVSGEIESRSDRRLFDSDDANELSQHAASFELPAERRNGYGYPVAVI